jgi:nitroreductase
MGLESFVESAVKRLPSKLQRPLLTFALGQIELLRLIHCTLYDLALYRKGWGGKRPYDKGSLEAKIIKTYHNIEKGLALPTPRAGFGKDAINSLVSNTKTYIDLFGPDATTKSVINSLQAYIDYNKPKGVDTASLENTVAFLNARQGEIAPHPHGGTIERSRQEIQSAGNIDFSAFLQARHSIRQFTPEPASRELLEKAIRMAQRAPSVCNRQSGSAHIISQGKALDTILSLQGGNRGFTDQISTIIVITSRIDTFLHAVERHQHWIDGGLFAMTLVYALHSLGLGSCCLHWDVSPKKDKKMKQIAQIPNNQAVVMLIAVGNLPEKLVVAESPRRNIEDVCFFKQ